jgi:CheY-like chemotaxis protein
MDIGLPGISGIETVRQLRSLEENTGRSTPVIAVTADRSAETKTACMEAGMNDFLTKPFKIGEFRKLLLRWLYEPHKPNLKLLDSTVDPGNLPQFNETA